LANKLHWLLACATFPARDFIPLFFRPDLAFGFIYGISPLTPTPLFWWILGMLKCHFRWNILSIASLSLLPRVSIEVAFDFVESLAFA